MMGEIYNDDRYEKGLLANGLHKVDEDHFLLKSEW